MRCDVHAPTQQQRQDVQTTKVPLPTRWSIVFNYNHYKKPGFKKNGKMTCSRHTRLGCRTSFGWWQIGPSLRRMRNITHVTHHTSHTSHVIHVTHHTRHTSHITHHTSTPTSTASIFKTATRNRVTTPAPRLKLQQHVTHHTSHVTRHITSPRALVSACH